MIFFSSSSGFYDVQVAQVLLTLPYSFSQLGMVSGIIFQVFYGLLGSYTAYLISILYIEYRSRKEKENVSFKNHVIQVRYQTTIQNFSTLYTVPFCFCSEIWNKFHFNFFSFFCSGLKCWKACWVHTGKLLDWPSTALFSSLDPLSSLLLVQGMKFHQL